MTRDEAIQIIQDQLNLEFSYEIGEAYLLAIKTLKLPEIVMCKDCQYSSTNCKWCRNPDLPIVCVDKSCLLAISPDWYCASGKPKEKNR